MTNIAAYITTNGIMVYNADNVVVWAWTTVQEMAIWIEDSEGFTNPFTTSTLYKPIRWELRVSCSNNSLNHMQEWYECEATL